MLFLPQGVALVISVTVVLFTGLLASLLLPRQRFLWMVAGLLGAGLALLMSEVSPFPRPDVTPLQAGPAFYGVLLITLLFFAWQLIRLLAISTIRARLLIAFILLVLLPLAVVTGVASITGLQESQARTIDQLESVTTLKEAEIDFWVNSLHTTLELALQPNTPAATIPDLLDGSLPPAEQESASASILANFQYVIGETGLLEELFLLNQQGRVILSTDLGQENKILNSTAFFREGLQGPYTDPPLFSPSLNRVSIVVARPIRDEQGQVAGVLAGRASLDRLSEIMLERAGLGSTGETYLVSSNRALLTESLFAGFPLGNTYVRTAATEVAVAGQSNGSGLYDTYRGAPVVGVYQWLPELQIALVAEQSQQEAFRDITNTLTLNAVVALTALIVAGLASLFVTRSIARPLGELAATARQIEAGDLSVRASVEREDEIGSLAQAFNTMTGQLRQLIGVLEQRVAERTRALETSVQVSRNLSTILDQNTLMFEVVQQVQSAFDYYHAQIYLFDEAHQNLVLMAATGEAGRQLRLRGHKLLRGQGLVGRAAQTNEVVLAPDVTSEPGWLPNPLLPDTKAEVAVPIASGHSVLGVLDVQHSQVNALNDGDAALLRSIADQVAIALQNARLFEQAKHQAEQELFINTISQRIQNATSVESVLQITAQALGETLGMDRATVELSLSHAAGRKTTPPDGGRVGP
ncbi:MAG: GAF domain-containing protein [Chloroflexi bacterium]|nr:GAF domain-containing protein [Chloroflexota bacterium]MCI0578321.1 GAF domain-containing protein [Chloroflexota bacterium]MCI0649011.1 GAF domain-containing protein [Chloroflexota bacterium]MCI0729446.1 GAF domain-containing protein [Chloroflexota bacterium]